MYLYGLQGMFLLRGRHCPRLAILFLAIVLIPTASWLLARLWAPTFKQPVRTLSLRTPLKLLQAFEGMQTREPKGNTGPFHALPIVKSKARGAKLLSGHSKLTLGETSLNHCWTTLLYLQEDTVLRHLLRCPSNSPGHIERQLFPLWCAFQLG